MKKRCRQPETLRERCRHIFGDEPPVLNVWEAEFDYADAELQALAATDWRQITDWHLSVYYVLNLVLRLSRCSRNCFVILFPAVPCLLARNAVNPWLWRSLRGVFPACVTAALSLAGNDGCRSASAGTAFFAGDHAGANQSRARFQLSADLAGYLQCSRRHCAVYPFALESVVVTGYAG